MIPGDVPQWIVLPWLFAFGAVVGSFLNVCIYRIPQHERLIDQLKGLTHPPSSCPFCRRRILAIDNIPVFGWLALRGRCRFCRHWIPPRYALIEFFNGLLWVVLYVAIVPAGFTAKVSDSCLWSHLSPLATAAPGQDVFRLHAMYFYYLVLVEALLVASFIDFDLQIIPDGSTIPALVAGVLGSTLIGNLHLWPVWFQNTPKLQLLLNVAPTWLKWTLEGSGQPVWLIAHPQLHGFLSSMTGIAMGGGVVWILRRIGQWAWKREVMGFGDVVLMMTIGSFLGWQPTLMVFFVAPFCGLVAAVVSLQFLKLRELAYGPYLSMATLIVLLAWKVYFSRMEFWFDLGPLLAVVAVMMVLMMAVSLVVVRQIRLLLGFKDDDLYDRSEDWTSGDQLAFYANKNDDTNQRSETFPGSGRGGLHVPNWPGFATGQGRHFADRWCSGKR